MTVFSYSGWPLCDVDFVAGAMMRDEADKGQVFDPRTVASAFRLTTNSLSSVPLAYNLETGTLVWIDSNSGETRSGMSAACDTTIGDVVYDAVGRKKLTYGDLGTFWAVAHNDVIPVRDGVSGIDDLKQLVRWKGI